MNEKTNAQKQFEKIFNIRVRHLDTLEAELTANPINTDLANKVIAYRAFVAKEKANMDKLFAKMGWLA